MTSFLIHQFDVLKKHVLSAAGFKNIIPSDCRVLSLQIFKKTNQRVSETTLKRVYGFAYSKFRPSQFTLDAMAKFCDYTGWEDFCENNEDELKTKPVKDTSWENIKHNADKITNFTLQALKNRSGIPYQQSIKRAFINEHFDAFIKTDCTATILAAPAGYGKTIALCHWVEEKLASNAAGISDDIILFFSSNALINVFISGKDINGWLLSLLGYGTEADFSTILDIKQQHEGNFYLVIDGLDEHMFKHDQFHILLNQVLDIFSFYQFYTSFKLVLTMRTATWINYRHEVEDFKEKWFIGFTEIDDDIINVPLFTVNEIRELCTNINPSIQNFIGFEVAHNFNHPLYFQFYYKQHKDGFSLNNIDHVSIYELITTFILNKIYLGANATEKTLIIKALIEAIDLTGGTYEVHKYKLNDIIRQYSAAYNDLLGIGFIRELNKSSELQYNAVIQFGNNNFLNYSIARSLLYSNNNTFSPELIVDINGLYDNDHKVQVLKWSIMYAIKNDQQCELKYLAEASLTDAGRLEINVFINDMLEKNTHH